jgi:hypothetical protein
MSWPTTQPLSSRSFTLAALFKKFSGYVQSCIGLPGISFVYDRCTPGSPNADEGSASGARGHRGCADVVRFVGHTSPRRQVARELPFFGESGAGWRGHLSFRGCLVQTRKNKRQPHEARFHVVSGGFRHLPTTQIDRLPQGNSSGVSSPARRLGTLNPPA